MAATQMRPGTRRNQPPPPPPPSSIEPEMPWWDWLASFTPDQWNHLIVYPWRVSPMCDRKAAGKATAIGKLARRFDIDDILKEFGSGHYRFDVVQIDPTGKGQTRIRQEYVVIMNMDYPPRVPLGEWINDPENEMWKWAEEPLRLQQAQTQARIKAIEDGPAGNGADPTAIFSTVLEGVRSLRGEKDDNAGLAGQLVNMLMRDREAMQKLNDPVQQLATLKTLMDSLRPESKGADAATMMLEFMRDEVKALREELRESRGAKPPNFIEQLKEFTGVFTDVAPALGFTKRGAPNPNPANNAGGGMDWGNLAIQILDKGRDYLPVIHAAIMRPNGPQPAQQQQPSWRPPQIAPPVNNPTAEPSPTTTQAQPEQQQLDEATRELNAKMQSCWAKHQGLIQEVIPFVIDYYKSKASGLDLRDWFIDRRGRFAWVQLMEDSGPAVLTALVGTHPQLCLILTPPDQVLQFFTDFFTEQEPEEGDEDDPNVPVGAETNAI